MSQMWFHIDMTTIENVVTIGLLLEVKIIILQLF